MKSVQDLLAMPEEELSRKLAEVLRKKPWKHSNIADSREYGLNCNKSTRYASPLQAGHLCDSCILMCRKCNNKFTWYEHQHESCPDPDPIDINDWNVAMEWQRKYRADYAIFRDIYMVVKKSAEPIHLYVIWKWIANMCEPEEAKIRLIAAASAAGRTGRKTKHGPQFVRTSPVCLQCRIAREEQP